MVQHAVRSLARLARGVLAPRWVQYGFREQAAGGARARNLFGFEEGQGNLRAGDASALDQHVWISDGPEWLRGGTYMVVRRIRMHLEAWDRLPRADQETSVGRQKRSGAPLGVAGAARDGPSADSHVRLAHPTTNAGIRILRRGDSFADGLDQQGRLDSGTLFVCFQRDPGRQFVPLMRKLAASDRLHHYLTHAGSAVFALPPRAPLDSWVAAPLLDRLATS